eukprot:scaffold109723_cov32-Tisochrysis_lutea.AAC.1
MGEPHVYLRHSSPAAIPLGAADPAQMGQRVRRPGRYSLPTTPRIYAERHAQDARRRRCQSANERLPCGQEDQATEGDRPMGRETPRLDGKVETNIPSICSPQGANAPQELSGLGGPRRGCNL